jgi:hypothetical protein
VIEWIIYFKIPKYIKSSFQIIYAITLLFKANAALLIPQQIVFDIIVFI